MHDEGVFLTKKEAKEVYETYMDYIRDGCPIGGIDFSILLKTASDIDEVVHEMENCYTSQETANRFKKYISRD